jgi:hypothetical protein
MVSQGPCTVLCAITALIGVVSLFGAAGVACVVWAWGVNGRDHSAS